MKARRIVIVVAAFVALVTGGASAASAVLPNRTAGTGDWGCVVVRSINQGVCVSDPLPERLPLPEASGVPA
jgi:carbohydrate-selective porin OprB